MGKLIKAFGLFFIGILLLTILQPAQGFAQAQTTEVPEVPTDSYQLSLPGILIQAIPSSSIYGIEMTGELANSSMGGPVDQMINAGAYWVRNNGLIWSNVEPTQGARNWDANLDARLINAYQKHLQPILIIRSTPSWAQKYSGVYCGPIKSSALDAFATFMSDVVKRYGVWPYNVKYYEIWNEPDVGWSKSWPPDQNYGCWGEPSDKNYFGGGYYATMLKKIYPAIKQANPDAQVLVGGLLLDCDPVHPPAGKDCLSSKFLQGILANGGGNYFDGVSFHAYDYFSPQGNLNIPTSGLGNYSNSNWNSAWNTTGPAIIAKTSYLNNLLTQYGYVNKYLMDTEVGVRCAYLAIQYCDSQYSTSTSYQNTKAYFLVQVYAIARTLNFAANVWYSYYGWDSSGLYNASTGKLEPAYYAYQFTHQIIGDYTPAGEINPAPDVKGYEFIHHNSRIWVLWYVGGLPSNGETSTLVNLPSQPIAVWRWVNVGGGQPNEGTYQPSWLPENQQLFLDRSPTFVEFLDTVVPNRQP